ncbi:hypothetical protein ACLESO_03050, partial [Pyxidicoccus sp. 3LG]
MSSKTSALSRASVALEPPATSTRPSGSSTAPWRERAMDSGTEALAVPFTGSWVSTLGDGPGGTSPARHQHRTRG